MICQKLSYRTVRTYSQNYDWEFVDVSDAEDMVAISCDSVSDFVVIGLLNCQTNGMIQRFQCCVARRNGGFGCQVKEHIASHYKSTEWPRYFDSNYSVNIIVGKDGDCFVFGHLKAHVDVLSFSMFTFNPYERCVSGGIAKWVLSDSRLEGIEDSIFSTSILLRAMNILAFGYPMHFGYLEPGGSDARSFVKLWLLELGLIHGGES